MPQIEVDDGTRIQYEVEGTGPALLLIQGVSVAGCAWQPQIDALRDRYRCIQFDNRGLGGSLPCTGEITIERMSLDAIALLDALDIGSAHVAGHSMGGAIAQELALRTPERVASLALLCTIACGAEATRITPSMLWRTLRQQLGTRRMRRNAFLEMVSSPERRETHDPAELIAQLSHAFGRDLGDMPRVALRQARALARFDARPRLEALATTPTLVVSGSCDRVTSPESGRALSEAIPGSRYSEFQGAGHALPIQDAEALNALLREHLDAAGQR